MYCGVSFSKKYPPAAGWRPRLIAIDVDGTLLDRGRPLSPRVIQAVEQAHRAGAVITLASGRMFGLLRGLVEQLGIRAPVICYGGALIVDPMTGRPVFQRGIARELAHEVIRAGRQRGLPARAYLGDAVFVDRLDPTAFNYESLQRVRAQAVGDLIDFLTVDPSHLAIDSPPERTRGVVEEMRALLNGRLNVTTGHPLLTEFSHPDVHKGAALLWLAGQLRVPQGQTLAIGDDWNDREMILAAGLGVAVANAHPEILAIADALVPSAADDGVAIALERYVFAPKAGEGGTG